MDRTIGKPLCIFGVMTNDEGMKIAKEMLPWLQEFYDVKIVYHDGSQYEYPALAEAQKWSVEWDIPVLYIHTRGAVNTYPTTIPTRRMWREEFGNQWKKYFELARGQEPRVLCPFVDDDGETRYNGFVANAAAWRAVSLRRSGDRMIYERLWKGKGMVYGLLIHSECNDIKAIRQYLKRNYT